MLRYLKYIFLTFSLLAIAIGSFFFINNKIDVTTAFHSRDQLSYDSVVKNCPDSPERYYYPCFYQNLEKYMARVSLTGVSIGLKFAFNFMEQDKAHTTKFTDEKVRDLNYSVNFLEVNNLAIEHSYKRYFGLEFVYGGYLSKLEDFNKSAFEFSENILHGLHGKDGIVSVSDPLARAELEARMHAANTRFMELKTQAHDFVQAEIKKLLEKAQ